MTAAQIKRGAIETKQGRHASQPTCRDSHSCLYFSRRSSPSFFFCKLSLCTSLLVTWKPVAYRAHGECHADQLLARGNGLSATRLK